MIDQINVKKLVLYSIGVLMAIFFTMFIWGYLHKGVIIISTTDPGNSIIITDAKNEQNGSRSFQTYSGKGRLSVNVPLGNYVVAVSKGPNFAKQQIYLHSHKTLSYLINPVASTSAEPVAFVSGQGLVSDANQLIFLNTSSYFLNSINTSNSISTLSPTQQFQSSKWANVSYGVSMGKDNYLYFVKNGNSSLISAPFSYDAEQIDYDISSNSRTYISQGNQVFAGGPNGNFAKVFTAPASSLRLGASDNKVAVSYTTSNKNSTVFTFWLNVIQDNGKKYKTTVYKDVNQLAWSKGGDYLIAVTKSSAYVYNSSLKLVSTIQTGSMIGYLSWLDNKTVVYSNDGKIWKFNVTNQRSDLLSSLPLGSDVNGISISQEKDYIYVSSVQPTNNSSSLYRVSLNGKSAPKYIYQLADLLPMTLADCTISIVNFAKPTTILVQPFPNSGLGGPAYITEAQNELSQDGFDISKLQFVLSK